MKTYLLMSDFLDMNLVSILSIYFIGELCEDGTHTQCQQWSPGYFHLNDTWYDECPSGYYGDEASGTCKECAKEWTEWFGKTRFEWTAWDASLHFSLIETTWNKVVCQSGFYLDTTTLLCHSWDSGCKSCEYPDIHTCLEWDSIHKMLTPGSCTHWESVTGFEINLFGVWSEVWGDGLNFGGTEWDDGNNQDGDGWSSLCEVETGYKWEGTLWYEIVSPTATIVRMSSLNTATIQFSEPVKFSNYSSMKENLKWSIKGPNSPYKFEFSIVDPKTLENSDNFTTMYVSISNIKTTINGGGIETAEFWFEDLSVITDIAGNHMSEGRISGNLNYFEYISDGNLKSLTNIDDKKSAESSGSSMKYTILTMFSMNLLLKIIISSSAALMWSLIHVLQVFRYILMINLNMPKVVDILMKYLAVVIGEIDELEELVPDWFSNYVISNPTDLKVNITLYSRFEDNGIINIFNLIGYDSPFLAILFCKQVTIILWSFLISLPIIYFGIKIFKTKAPWIVNKLNEVWKSFWWNAPLRTFTELYIEISLAFFLNSLNVSI